MCPVDDPPPCTDVLWLDRLEGAAFLWADWFEWQPESSRTTAPVAFRGEHAPLGSDESVVALYAIADPHVAEGRALEVVVSLARDAQGRRDEPGCASFDLRFDPVHGVGSVELGWWGPVSGRFVGAGTTVDFFAADGCRVEDDGVGVRLELTLGQEWKDLDRTPRELLAAVEHVMILRDG